MKLKDGFYIVNTGTKRKVLQYEDGWWYWPGSEEDDHELPSYCRLIAYVDVDMLKLENVK